MGFASSSFTVFTGSSFLWHSRNNNSGHDGFIPSSNVVNHVSSHVTFMKGTKCFTRKNICFTSMMS